MKITIVTLFPNMIEGFVNDSILKRAQEKKLVEINIVHLRNFARDSYGTVDERPYGGGTGMVLCVDVLKKSLDTIKTSSPHSHVILTSARGCIFDQHKAQELAKLKELVIYAGHYEGFDERFSSYVDEEISLGDFVLTGGELTAASICDAVVRLIPGVLKKNNATIEESFSLYAIDDLMHYLGDNIVLSQLKAKGVTKVRLLEYPQYTRPETFEEKKVPPILLSGDPKKIKEWQLQEALDLTLRLRPDLLDK